MKERLASTDREPGPIEALGHRAWSCWISAYLRIWHRLQVHGRQHLPTDAPFVLIANHTSHLDALVLASLVPWRTRRSLYPIAAGDVFFERPSRAMLSSVLLNALPMRRRSMGRHALDGLRARLIEEPCGFILFPEGTRSATGDLQRFKAGLGMLIAGAEVPVVPCHLQGAFAAWPRTGKWPRPRPISVRIGAPLCFARTENTREGWLQIADDCHQAVTQLGDGVESAPRG